MLLVRVAHVLERQLEELLDVARDRWVPNADSRFKGCRHSP
jgi:hypothetical protein